jgi:hypothetical protein
MTAQPMDLYDHAPWTPMDIEDLKSSIEHGLSIEEAAEFLCRSGSIEDVRRKVEELRLVQTPPGCTKQNT